MTTVHGMDRALERIGLRRSKAEAFLEAGVTYGKTAESFKLAADRKYLESKSSEGIVAKVHQGYCFIVSTEWNGCITVYKLPDWFGKTHRYNGKKKIRNPMRYSRKYGYYILDERCESRR